MTTAADDRAAEEAFEASLAGRSVPGEAAGLAAFTSAVRGAATQPGRPSAALAELLSTGLLTDQSSASTRTTPSAGPLPSRSARSRTRRRFTVIVPALIAKLLSAGAVAQAATGAGVVVVVVAGAGATGVLPEGPQQTFDGLVGTTQAADDSQEVEKEDDLPEAGDMPEVEVPVTEPAQVDGGVDGETGDDVPDPLEQAWLAGPTDDQTFGEWVSLGRHEGWATGEIVSAKKHELNALRKDAREKAREAAKAARAAAKAAARHDDDADDDGSEVEVEVEVEDADDDSVRGESHDEAEDESSDDDGDRSGKGRGHGSGKGKNRD